MLVVSADGSIRADQLVRLGVRPGPARRLRVIAVSEPGAATMRLASSLPDFPDIEWDDFERASALAREDIESS